MVSDLRACFVGDSFVAGVGDPEHLGWVGRIAARTHRAGQPLTAYNLGIRRNTSDDVIARWRAECSQRLSAECTGVIVASFGVNDTVMENSQTRVTFDRSAANLETLLTQVSQDAWHVLVVGPAPVANEQHNHRISDLNENFHQICETRQTRYVDVFRPLLANSAWMREVEDGDGAHPSAGGYSAYAELVWPHWSTWIHQLNAS